MSKRKPKTFGVEWLYLSMASFNGSGYADKSSVENYVESYTYYKAWKKDKNAVELIKKHKVEALTFAENLIHAREAGHQPNKKKLDEFESFKNRAGLLL